MSTSAAPSAAASPEFVLTDDSEAVLDICRKLCQAGFPPLHATRHLDQIKEQLRAFQRRHLPSHAADGICDEQTWRALNRHAGASFSEVWQAELEALYPPPDAPPPEPHPARHSALCARAHQLNLCGLAFSGGGVRSATFNLGFLQALAENRLLHRFDYLSTVSGGGYIGGWLSKWIAQEKGKVEEVEKLLRPGTSKQPLAHERHEVRFLRQHANYLTPKSGLFSIDTWAMMATWLRNTLLNLCVMVALMAALMIVPYLLVGLVRQYHTSHAAQFASFAIGSVAFAVFCMSLHLSLLPDPKRRSQPDQRKVILFIILPLLAAASSGCVALWEYRDTLMQGWRELNPHWMQENGGMGLDSLLILFQPGLYFFLFWSAGWICAQILNRRVRKNTRQPLHWANVWQSGIGHFLSALVSMAVGSVLLMATLRFLQRIGGGDSYDNTFHGVHLLGIGIPSLFVVYGLTMVLHVGLLGRLYSEQNREWWSRLGGWTAIILLAWVALFFMSFYAPPVASWLHHKYEGWASGAIGSGWLLTTVTGLLAGHSRATGGKMAEKGGDPKLEFISMHAPWVFTVGLLGIVATGLHFALNPGHIDNPLQTVKPQLIDYIRYYLHYTSSTHHVNLWFALGCLLSIALLMAWRLDVNRFSLYMMACNRVVRAYLGASNKQRQPHPFTGFDVDDDPRLETLATSNQGQIQRPYHLINTSLNLVTGQELAWQNRRAASFIFSPLFCGFEAPTHYQSGVQFDKQMRTQGCFRPTAEYASQADSHAPSEQGTRLGMAVTISGAAVSPAMGYHTSPAMCFLLTMFNLRLGRWCANPRKHKWRRAGPRIGLFALLHELLGNADTNADYVYLSDGGHFDNLGLFELVRRRCRLIVLVDASADGELNFEDLGNAIRKCYTELAIEIALDVSPIEGDGKNSQRHCVAGTIHYEKTDQWGETDMEQGTPGVLLYVKPSLTGKELAELLNYRKSEKGFPHESALAQSFDETQFESYRALGYRIGGIACPPLAEGSSNADWSRALLQAWGRCE